MEANVHAKYKAIIMLARFSGLLVLCSSTSSMGAFTMERRSTIVYPLLCSKTVSSLVFICQRRYTLDSNNCRLPIPSTLPSRHVCHVGDHRNIILHYADLPPIHLRVFGYTS